jgi:hypothetical protein
MTGEDRPRFSGTTNKVTERNNTDQILDRLINWQYFLPPIKLFYIECRELENNKDSHPFNWKSVKST